MNTLKITSELYEDYNDVNEKLPKTKKKCIKTMRDNYILMNSMFQTTKNGHERTYA
jgi:hypothetical protein